MPPYGWAFGEGLVVRLQTLQLSCENITIPLQQNFKIVKDYGKREKS